MKVVIRLNKDLLLKNTVKGIEAGIMVSIGGSVFLGCDNKIVGSVLFCVALIVICINNYSLYTGKIGFILECRTKEENAAIFLGLLGNIVGTLLCGWILRAGIPALGSTASEICAAKLTQNAFSTLIRGIFCGILMYCAVSTFRNRNTLAGILFCIPVFILSGFEHSIADVFYFTIGGSLNPKAIAFLCIVLVGNSVGANVMPLLNLVEKSVGGDKKTGS